MVEVVNVIMTIKMIVTIDKSVWHGGGGGSCHDNCCICDDRDDKYDNDNNIGRENVYGVMWWWQQW